MFNNNANTSSSLSSSINVLLWQWKWQSRRKHKFKDQNSPFLEVGIVLMLSRLFVFTLTRDPSACACVCAMLTFHLAILLPFFFGRPPNFALLRNEKKKERLIAVQCYACVTLKVNIHNINSLCHHVSLRLCPPCISMAVVRRRAFFFPSQSSPKKKSQQKKTGSKNVQLVLQYCCQTSWKAVLRVLPPTFKPILRQIRLLQIAEVVAKSRE